MGVPAVNVPKLYIQNRAKTAPTPFIYVFTGTDRLCLSSLVDLMCDDRLRCLENRLNVNGLISMTNLAIWACSSHCSSLIYRNIAFRSSHSFQFPFASSGRHLSVLWSFSIRLWNTLPASAISQSRHCFFLKDHNLSLSRQSRLKNLKVFNVSVLNWCICLSFILVCFHRFLLLPLGNY